MAGHEFVEKPATVVAFQWDGTANGAKSLSEFFQENFYRAEVLFHSMFTDGGLGEYTWLFIKGTRLRCFEDQRVLDGDVVVLKDGSADLLSKEAFVKRYAPKEGD